MAASDDRGELPRPLRSPLPSHASIEQPSGACVWLTGLSGSGKSTTARVLRDLLEAAGRTVTLLDGDAVREALSPGLGFSRADRDAHVRRVGYIAAEIVRHGGTVICAIISPYRSTREEVRGMIGAERFVEVLVDTPIEVCEQRDPKGLYARARRGEIGGFTGIDDPYEPPERPDLTLDTVAAGPDDNAVRIVELLRDRGLIAQGRTADPGTRHDMRAGSPARRRRNAIYTMDLSPDAATAGPDAAGSRAGGGHGGPVPLLLPTRASSLVPDLPSTCVYLVRHGTTLLNRQQRYRGRIDVPLDKGGWQDAWAAAAELGDSGVDAIYCSPLRRARDTGRVIADAAGIPSVTDLPGLINLDYGEWEGLTPDEAAALHPDEYARYQAFTDDAECPRGERLLAAAERTLHSLHVLNLLHPGGTVVAVSHAVIVRLAIALVTGAPRAGWRRNLPNGSVTRFDVGPETITLISTPEPVAAVVD